jgi:hypothetical protein
MLNFITTKLAAGCVPLTFTVRKTVFGNEAEFLYRIYHNSRTNCIKVAYNISGAQRRACIKAIDEHDKNLITTRLNGIITNQKRTRRKGG